MATPPKKSPKAAAKKPNGPKTIDILVEAIKAVDDPKGASIQAIKTYVLTQYPDKDPVFIKSSLKKAIQKGFDEELLVRPKKSEIAGASLSGRLKLNKAKIAQNEKAAKAKTKVAEKKAAKKDTTKEKPKKAEKKSTKKTPTKSPKTKTAKKSTVKKSAEKSTKSKPKTPTKTKKAAAAKTKTTTPEKTKGKKTTKTPMKPLKTPKSKKGSK